MVLGLSGMQTLAAIVVAVFGVALVAFGILSFVRPEPVRRFLRLFASSARAHYTEQTLRLVVGAALVVDAPRMLFADAFSVLGWLIAITAVVLLLVPWRWHHRFAERVIPLVIRFLPLYASVALGLGLFVLYGMLA